MSQVEVEKKETLTHVNRVSKSRKGKTDTKSRSQQLISQDETAPCSQELVCEAQSANKPSSIAVGKSCLVDEGKLQPPLNGKEFYSLSSTQAVNTDKGEGRPLENRLGKSIENLHKKSKGPAKKNCDKAKFLLSLKSVNTFQNSSILMKQISRLVQFIGKRDKNSFDSAFTGVLEAKNHPKSEDMDKIVRLFRLYPEPSQDICKKNTNKSILEKMLNRHMAADSLKVKDRSFKNIINTPAYSFKSDLIKTIYPNCKKFKWDIFASTKRNNPSFTELDDVRKYLNSYFLAFLDNIKFLNWDVLQQYLRILDQWYSKYLECPEKKVVPPFLDTHTVIEDLSIFEPELDEAFDDDFTKVLRSYNSEVWQIIKDIYDQTRLLDTSKDTEDSQPPAQANENGSENKEGSGKELESISYLEEANLDTKKLSKYPRFSTKKDGISIKKKIGYYKVPNFLKDKVELTRTQERIIEKILHFGEKNPQNSELSKTNDLESSSSSSSESSKNSSYEIYRDCSLTKETLKECDSLKKLRDRADRSFIQLFYKDMEEKLKNPDSNAEYKNSRMFKAILNYQEDGSFRAANEGKQNQISWSTDRIAGLIDNSDIILNNQRELDDPSEFVLSLIFGNAPAFLGDKQFTDLSQESKDSYLCRRSSMLNYLQKNIVGIKSSKKDEFTYYLKFLYKEMVKGDLRINNLRIIGYYSSQKMPKKEILKYPVHAVYRMNSTLGRIMILKNYEAITSDAKFCVQTKLERVVGFPMYAKMKQTEGKFCNYQSVRQYDQ